MVTSGSMLPDKNGHGLHIGSNDPQIRRNPTSQKAEFPAAKNAAKQNKPPRGYRFRSVVASIFWTGGKEKSEVLEKDCKMILAVI